MISNIVGFVVKVDRGEKKSTITLKVPSSKVILKDGKYLRYQDGFFSFNVWEENLMAGTQTKFSKIMDMVKNGNCLAINYELTQFQNQDKENSYAQFVLTANKIEFIYFPRLENNSGKSTEYWKAETESDTKVLAEEKEWSEISEDPVSEDDDDLQISFTPDPF